jgi:hypothetical protein
MMDLQKRPLSYRLTPCSICKQVKPMSPTLLYYCQECLDKHKENTVPSHEKEVEDKQ